VFRVAVDAFNLVADRRGMGRHVRQILGQWSRETDIDVTLIVRDPQHLAPLRSEFPFDVRSIGEAANGPVDAVWYPWNGIRFDLDARKVVTMYDAFAFEHPHRSWIARRREQAPIRRAAREADALATLTRWSAAQIARCLHLDPQRLTLVGAACDPFWQPYGETPDGQPYIFFLGGPEPRKNAGLLFDAFARAFGDRRARLVVGGTLNERDERRLREAPFAHERVRPDDPTLRALYGGALAVAVPSYDEGFGLPAIEAMACGAPVLAADAAALPEACDGAALLLPSRDADAWAQALTRVAADRALRDDLRARSLARIARLDSAAPARITLELLRRSL